MTNESTSKRRCGLCHYEFNYDNDEDPYQIHYEDGTLYVCESCHDNHNGWVVSMTQTIESLRTELEAAKAERNALKAELQAKSDREARLERALGIVVSHMPMGAIVRRKIGWKRNDEIIARAIELAEREQQADTATITAGDVKRIPPSVVEDATTAHHGLERFDVDAGGWVDDSKGDK